MRRAWVLLSSNNQHLLAKRFAVRGFHCEPYDSCGRTTTSALASSFENRWRQRRPYNNHHFRDFSSTSSQNEASDATSSQNDKVDDDASAMPTSEEVEPRRPRNKTIAKVMRDGLSYLNHTANAIQKNKHASQPLFATPEELNKPTPKHLAEEHRLLSTAEESLAFLCHHDPNFPLMAANEPIHLIKVKCTQSMSHADLYWTMPYPILSSPDLNDRQRGILQSVIEKRIQGQAGGLLKSRIYAILRDYYPPKLRFKAAPPSMVAELMEQFEG